LARLRARQRGTSKVAALAGSASRPASKRVEPVEPSLAERFCPSLAGSGSSARGGELAASLADERASQPASQRERQRIQALCWPLAACNSYPRFGPLALHCNHHDYFTLALPAPPLFALKASQPDLIFHRPLVCDRNLARLWLAKTNNNNSAKYCHCNGNTLASWAARPKRPTYAHPRAACPLTRSLACQPAGRSVSRAPRERRRRRRQARVGGEQSNQQAALLSSKPR